MSSVFADLWRAAEPDLDATLGEPFRYMPRAVPFFNGAPDVNARSIADPSRTEAGFVGRFSEMPKETTPRGRNKPSSSAHRLSGAAPTLCLSSGVATQLQIDIGGPFAVDDLVWREDGDLYFRVENVEPLDLGMVELLLTRLGS
jgi:hypothetical protein